LRKRLAVVPRWAALMQEAWPALMQEPARARAGLTFLDLGEAPQDTFQRLSALFFIMLLFELLPFCYMSFYVADRQCAPRRPCLALPRPRTSCRRRLPRARALFRGR